MNDMNSLELKISKFLRIGVILSGIILLAGWFMNFKLRGSFVNFEIYDHIPLPDLLRMYAQIGNWGVITSYVGLFTLISLPLIRVLLTAYLFFRQKEYLLAGIASFVFFALILSMSLGIEL